MDTVLAVAALIVIGVVLGLWIRALVALAQSALPTSEKAIWAVVLIAAPGLGLLAFLLIDPISRRRASLA